VRMGLRDVARKERHARKIGSAPCASASMRAAVARRMRGGGAALCTAVRGSEKMLCAARRAAMRVQNDAGAMSPAPSIVVILPSLPADLFKIPTGDVTAAAITDGGCGLMPAAVRVARTPC